MGSQHVQYHQLVICIPQTASPQSCICSFNQIIYKNYDPPPTASATLLASYPYFSLRVSTSAMYLVLASSDVMPSSTTFCQLRFLAFPYHYLASILLPYIPKLMPVLNLNLIREQKCFAYLQVKSSRSRCFSDVFSTSDFEECWQTLDRFPVGRGNEIPQSSRSSSLEGFARSFLESVIADSKVAMFAVLGVFMRFGMWFCM